MCPNTLMCARDRPKEACKKHIYVLIELIRKDLIKIGKDLITERYSDIVCQK